MPHSMHPRNTSDPASAKPTAAPLILDHVLSYEIPLRTMYTLNCAPRSPTTSDPGSLTPSASDAATSPSSISSPLTPHDDGTHAFQRTLMDQISQLPQQPASLPPSFVVNFLHRCFPPELVLVDFPQALTALDYLKDLDMRRRRDVAAAMLRLDTMSAADRLAALEEKERKISALYEQLYVGLRRWILVNELSLLPFNKHSCVAMLNTLYPPVVPAPPSDRLTRPILQNQRDGFFKYIVAVEKSGTRVLVNLMQQGKAPADSNGWPAVTRCLDRYLRLALSVLDDCAAAVSSPSPRSSSSSHDVGAKPEHLHPTTTTKPPSRAGSKPSSRHGSTPADPAPSRPRRPSTPSVFSHHRSTALEKLARGLKTIGRSRTDATEMIAPPPSAPPSLRKMQSMGTLEVLLPSKTGGGAGRVMGRARHGEV